MGGHRYIHHAIDDYSRMVYSEILDDERKDTAAGFIQRAHAFFKDLGITVQAVMTDNGTCYRSQAFNQVLTAAGVKHRYTRPYQPQTNRKVERFNRTLTREWAYTHYTSQTQREADYQTWLHHYNHHRPHTTLNGQTPHQPHSQPHREAHLGARTHHPKMHSAILINFNAQLCATASRSS